jgi:hypothetical protein
MKKNTLEAYKEAIKEKYEVEKSGIHSSFLLQPSRARLRNLCFELLKENANETDLMCFKAFLGFEFDVNHLNKLKGLTDKFRPVETFLKGETDLNDVASANIAAVLVGFTPRPYLKFSSLAVDFPQKTHFTESHLILTQAQPSEIIKKTASNELNSEKSPPLQNLFFRKPFLFMIPLFVCLIVFYGYKIYNQKECMQWNEDHYERVDCKTEQAGLLQSVEKIALNETVFVLRKITVSENTTFFKNEKPQVWYCKKNKKVEFFNGPGFHPENGKVLKPITTYMINKYVVKK